MSTVQHSSLAAVRRNLAGLLEGDLCFGEGGTWATYRTFLATLVPGDLLFDRGDLAALGDLLLCRGDLTSLGDLLLALGDLFTFFTMCSEVP